MRKIFLLLTVITSSILLESFSTPDNDPALVGSWYGKMVFAPEATISFDKDGYVSLSANGKSIGGKKITDNGSDFSMTYVANTKTSPKQIDIITTSLDRPGVKSTMFKGIYEFTKDKKLKIILSDKPGPRPESFEKATNEELMILSKTITEDK